MVRLTLLNGGTASSMLLVKFLVVLKMSASMALSFLNES